MLYAKVVFGLAVQGPFDYFVPGDLRQRIKVGSRVKVSFRKSRLVGYCVALSRTSDIKNIKPVLEVLDLTPVIGRNMLLLARALGEYYCCSLGEVIRAALPEALRRGKATSIAGACQKYPAGSGYEPILVHDLNGNSRWDIYLDYIKEVLAQSRSAIVILPDISSVNWAKNFVEQKLNIPAAVLYRKQPHELEEWLKIKEGKARLVLGTRSGIFAPLNNPGLIIIDEEENPVYKQEQVPHYNAREAAFMRARIEKLKLVLGSISPSLESIYLAKSNKIKYSFLPRKKGFPEMKVIDANYERRFSKGKNSLFSNYLKDAVNSCLSSGGRALLFLNRKGFATAASCNSCGRPLKCPRCNVNLVYYFNKNALSCRYCNYKIVPPKICPLCNSGYIRYTGAGTEKIESELTRIFPQAKIKRLDCGEKINASDADIFVATSAIIKQESPSFDLIGILSIDNTLNRVDLRSSEKAFGLLSGLLGLTEKKVIIETGLPNSHCFEAIFKNDPELFYDEELRQRKQLRFPPYSHMILVKLRGSKDERVKEASRELFEKLKSRNKDKRIRFLSVNPGQPAKLRGNFYWQLLINSSNPKRASAFLKINLKDFSASGIIVTVDVDPL